MYKNTFFAASTALVTILLITSVLGNVTNMYGTIFVTDRSLFAKKDTITICHIPDDPDITMEVNEHALTGHLKHNDYLGPCLNGSSSSSSSSSDSSSSESSVPSSSSSSSSESSMSSSSSSSSSSESSSASSSQDNSDSNSSSSESSSAPPSSSSSEKSNKNSSKSSNNTISAEHHNAPLEHAEGSGPIFRGSGIAELAAVTHNALVQYGLHRNAPYKFTFHHENIRPEEFESHESAMDWGLREHAACCSIYRYLTRLREVNPNIKPGYIDWLTEQLAKTLNENPIEIRAALLGYPHAHPHTSDLVRSITAEGCAEHGYVYGAANSEQSNTEHELSTHLEHVVDPSLMEEPLTIQQQNIPNEIAFAVMDGEEVFDTYGVSHTKEMHLLIVRDDLRYFYHVHPERDPNGIWHVPFVPPVGGTYWIYADFVGIDDKAHTIRFERTYDGDPGEKGLTKNMRKVKFVGRFFVALEATPYEHGTLFTLTIQDKIYGDTPYLDEYLGAMGHGILISPTGAFIHTHPSYAGDALVFHTPILTENFYRIFTQFQIGGELMTVEFDWEPHANDSDKK